LITLLHFSSFDSLTLILKQLTGTSLIGTFRRESLDQTLFWIEMDLQKKLDDFTDYYNNHRVHSSIHGAVPTKFGEERISSPTTLTKYGWNSLCRGLYQLPVFA